MSDTGANNLSEQRIQQLLAAVGSRPPEDNTQVQTTDYDWHRPHYFGSEQIKKLDDFAKILATAIAGKFTSLCQSDFSVTVVSITQHFAAEFCNETSDSKQEYFLGFGTNRAQLCGVVGVPNETAVVWARQLLGESETEGESDKDLSQLEVSLLSDIASGIIEVLSGSYESFDFRPVDSFVKGELPLKLSGSEVLCKIAFNVKGADSENASDAYLLILCSELDFVAGKTESIGGPNALSPEEVPKAILQHIEQINVNVTAQLSETQLTFDQILNLQVNDILVLGRRVNEPIELKVDGRRVYRSWPAKSAGQYAVVFKEDLK